MLEPIADRPDMPEGYLGAAPLPWKWAENSSSTRAATGSPRSAHPDARTSGRCGECGSAFGWFAHDIASGATIFEATSTRWRFPT
jgi:hypothetical protein